MSYVLDSEYKREQESKNPLPQWFFFERLNLFFEADEDIVYYVMLFLV